MEWKLVKCSIPPSVRTFDSEEELVEYLKSYINNDISDLPTLLSTNKGCEFLVYVDGQSWDEMNNRWR